MDEDFRSPLDRLSLLLSLVCRGFWAGPVVLLPPATPEEVKLASLLKEPRLNEFLFRAELCLNLGCCLDSPLLPVAALAPPSGTELLTMMISSPSSLVP